MLPKQYSVTIVQSVSRTVQVLADNEEQARQNVEHYGIDLAFNDFQEDESKTKCDIKIKSVKVK
jgi:hypothetical protein